MRLLDLYMNGFGKFHDRELTFHQGLNVVYGKNEAGKSTVHTFIRGMLFGIERQRGRASRNDLYTKYEPWENSGTYEGRLRVEHKGNIYRIERSFQKNNKEFTIVNETLGRETEPTRAFLDELYSGLTETTFNNTISIGQLKSATDAAMAAELKNYIANLNTTGNIALNITKASTFLKNQRRELESQMVPEAARSYTSLLSEIRNIEKEISTPEYENQIQAYKTMRTEVSSIMEKKQQEKEDLLQKAAKAKQILENSGFTDQTSISSCQLKTQELYRQYLSTKALCEKKSRKVIPILWILLAAVLLLTAGVLYFLDLSALLQTDKKLVEILSVLCAGSSLIPLITGLLLSLKNRRWKRELEKTSALLKEVFVKYISNPEINELSVASFMERMSEFTMLNATVTQTETSLKQLTGELSSLSDRQTTCGDVIEKQQRTQWELEQKLEHLGECKTQAEALKHTLTENERIREELSAIDLAQETMNNLSSTIRDSFGLYLNKAASDMISGITGGIYKSISVDENLNVYMNTKTKLVPIEQVSSGTMDQAYLALRLAAARLLMDNQDQMPLIFDDSFTLYDEDRLKTVLKWLTKTYQGQIIMFTCHQREAQMLTANLMPFHLIRL